MSQLDRADAVLTWATKGQMQRINESHLAAFCELADDDNLTLAELLQRRNCK